MDEVLEACLSGDGEAPVTLKVEVEIERVEDEMEQLAEHLHSGYDFGDFQNMDVIDSKNSKGAFECNYCGKLFKRRGNLAIHIGEHTGAGRHACRQCGLRFALLTPLRAHEKTHKQLFLKCEHCPYRTGERSKLTIHSRTHTGELPYKCPYCGRNFAQSDYLRRHERRHTGEKRYACAECGKTFFDCSNLRKHSLVHSGEKRYTCGQCGQCFSRSGHLNRHLRAHEDLRPFACPVCARAFICRSNMNKHMKNHLKVKHDCLECGKHFANSANLEKHMATHA